MTQDEIFDQVFEKYKTVFPDMVHGSGGLPDTKGEGTSDVDIMVFSNDHTSLSKHFPPDTEIVASSPVRTIYRLKGYPREVNLYCTAAEWWQNSFHHRTTELALKQRFPSLAAQAYDLKKTKAVSTEEAWARVLGLGENYHTELLDTEKILHLAEEVNKSRKS